MLVRIIRVPFLIPTWAAAQVLIPRTILVRRGIELTPQLLAHEMAHVWQIQRLGLLGYWFAYLRLLAQHGYVQHPMEIEAQRHSYSAEGLGEATRMLLGEDRLGSGILYFEGTDQT